MRVIIDIPEEDYILATKEDFSAIYNGNHIAKAIKNGTSLDDIKAEIAEYKDDKVIHAERNEMIDIMLEIIDKHTRCNVTAVTYEPTKPLNDA